MKASGEVVWAQTGNACFRKSGRRKGARQREDKEEEKVNCREDEDKASWEMWGIEGTVSQMRPHCAHTHTHAVNELQTEQPMSTTRLREQLQGQRAKRR